MRILHLISSKGLYGAERVVIELSKGLKKIKDCRPIIGVINNTYNSHVEMIDEANESQVESVVFPCSSQFDFKTILLIRKYVKANNIDLIHCHGYKSNFYGLFASGSGVRTISTNHNWLTSHWKLKIYCFLDSLWMRYFNEIVAVSDEVKKDMMRYKVPRRKIHIIDNGIDPDRFDLTDSGEAVRREFDLDRSVNVIGIIGNLGYEKGHQYLLMAAKEIVEIEKAVKILIIGGGSLRTHLENETARLGLSNNVIFAGYRKDIPDIISALDIFVIPSVKEGLPMVLLEAMAAKKPVVASKVGAIPKVILDDSLGILVEPGNVSQLTQAILSLINDVDKAKQTGLNGYNRVKEFFSSDVMAGNYYSLYKEILN